MATVLSGAATAQELTPLGQTTPDYAACLGEMDKTKRLECYDKALNYSKGDLPSKNQPKPILDFSVTVRQKADFDGFGGKNLLAQPAQLAINQSDGKDSSTVKLGLIGAFRPINELGWQPYIAGAWNRDTSGKTPSDLRDIAAGITGPLWDVYDKGWTISPNVKLRHRTDLFGKEDGSALVLHGNLVVLPWVNSVPRKDTFSYVLVPYIGLQAENRQDGSDKGGWRSGYLGAQFNANLGMILPRLSFQGKVQNFHDQSAPEGSLRRTENYVSGALSYALTDPNDKSITVRPAITIQRETGNDLLSGNGIVHKTVIGVTLQVD